MLFYETHPVAQDMLIGHQEAFAQLQRAFEAGRLSPCWLLVGERGIGKATFAYHFARYVFRDDPGAVRQMMAGTYPNLMVIGSELAKEGKLQKEITIDEIRRVTPFLRNAAALPGWRIVIIDAGDEMNRNAANAFLKLLEEPPQKTIIFIVAHRLGQILPTIRSRCAKIFLHPLTDEDLAPYIPDKSQQALLLPLARGSFGRLKEIMAVDPTRLLKDLWRSLYFVSKGNTGNIEPYIQFVAGDETLFSLLLDILPWWLHRLITQSITKEVPALLLPEEGEAMRHLISLKGIAHWVEALEKIVPFIQVARSSHLDKVHFLWSIFYIVENPQLGERFLYAT